MAVGGGHRSSRQSPGTRTHLQFQGCRGGDQHPQGPPETKLLVGATSRSQDGGQIQGFLNVNVRTNHWRVSVKCTF